MSKVMTFSRAFPAYHPKKGQPTGFVEKILYGLIKEGFEGCGTELLKHPIVDTSALNPDEIKWHTIRAGNRWKVGDWFSPRVWSGKPYNSPMITIAPDIQVKKTFDFQVMPGIYWLNGRWRDGEIESHHELLETIASNDGLSKYDLLHWFKEFNKPFKGQIICWNDKINY